MRDFNETNGMLKLVHVAIVIERSTNVKVGREAYLGPDINAGRGRNRMKSVRWVGLYIGWTSPVQWSQESNALPLI